MKRSGRLVERTVAGDKQFEEQEEEDEKQKVLDRGRLLVVESFGGDLHARFI